MFNDFRTDYTSGDATWEILIMLLVAFILGWLLHHFLCCKSKKHVERDTNTTTITRAQAMSSAATPAASVAKVVEKPAAPVAKAKSAPVASASTSNKDDLKKVEGIGPKIEGLLNVAGVKTWRALATTKIDFIQDVLDKAGPRYRMHNPKTWPVQSQLLDEGKFDELKELQDSLTAGRE